jgi:hypothetical protein
MRYGASQLVSGTNVGSLTASQEDAGMTTPCDAPPTLESIYGEETAAWMRLSPQARWTAMSQPAEWYHALGGTNDPDPDPASPFHDPDV